MDLILEVLPNNLVTVGLQSLLRQSRKGGDDPVTNCKTRLATHYGNAQLEIVQGYSGGAITNHYGLDRYKVLHKGEVRQWQEAKTRSLDIIHEVQANKRQAKQDAKLDRKLNGRIGFGRLPRRSTKFTRLARQRILSGGTIVKRASTSPSDSTFVTLTVPGNTEGVGDSIARWATYLANRALQAIRDSKRRGNPCEYFYCWEYQKRGVLHMHLVIFSPKPGISFSVGNAVVERWFGALKSLQDKGVDAFSRRGGRECVLPKYWQADVQPCQKSVAAYVSKYVTKQQAQGSRVSADSPHGKVCFSPGRFWGMSRNLVQSVRRFSSKAVVRGLTEDDCSSLVARIVDKLLNSKGLVQEYHYSFDVDCGERHIGSGFRYLFYLADESYDYFRNLAIGVCADISNLVDTGVSVEGRNWLYQQAKGLCVVAPSWDDCLNPSS